MRKREVNEKYILYQRFKWCPGAESNHRHEDFQSTALPLSYPGTGEGEALGWRRFIAATRGCPEGFVNNLSGGLRNARLHSLSICGVPSITRSNLEKSS